MTQQSIDHQLFSSKLLKWFHHHKRDLPFRGTRDPYQIWISEIMLQQTTVSTVIPRFTKWINVFPDVGTLARASLRKVMAQWQGLGYYNRARNLHQAARIICQDYQGRVPEDSQILSKLPGFGPYTVAAVLSIAFNKPVPLIDANVRRVMMRVFALKGKADASRDKIIMPFLAQSIPYQAAGNFKQALMELGAMVCDYRKPLCLQCPIREFCKAYELNNQETIPEKVKKNIKVLHAVVGVIERDGKYLIQQRAADGLLGGLWEFPGGKIRDGETSRQALARELKEEINVDLTDAVLYFKTHHFYTQFKVYLDVWKCSVSSYPGKNTVRKWVTLKGFDRYAFPSGSVKIIEQLRKESSCRI